MKKTLLSRIRRRLKRLPERLRPARTELLRSHADLETMGRVLEKQYRGYADAGSYAFVVFSMDRPLQLHALMSSYSAVGMLDCPLYVFFRATTESYGRAYRQLKEELSPHGNFRFVVETEETAFNEQIVRLLRDIPESRIGFLVDDIVFIRKCELSKLDRFDLRMHVPSLRLSGKIEYSYTMDKKEALPAFTSDGDFLKWEWKNGADDWAYPLSLDGNILLKSDILALLENIEFSSPNTLESRLQKFNNLYMNRFGLCFHEAQLVNVPANRVQRDFENRSGNLTIESMLEKWQSGHRIVYEELSGLHANSVHVEHEFKYALRKN